MEPTPALVACVTGVSTAGALLEMCLPEIWNGELLVWGHGYTNPGPSRPPFTPLALPSDEASGVAVRDIVRALGTETDGFYGYASTSYRRNGLVAPEAAQDLGDVSRWARTQLASLAAFEGFDALPVRTYLVGASEGGLSTVLAAEGPDATATFGGALALCAPVGDFRRQINWFGDFRVAYDYFFPGLMPGTAVDIPDVQITEANWATVQQAIRSALDSEPVLAEQLVGVTGVPFEVENPETIQEAATEILRYSFFGTNDATEVLGGNPFENRATTYQGSSDDDALNAGVARHAADASALQAIASGFETSGAPHVPLVAMHTTGDPVTPFWHLERYAEKNATAGGQTAQAIPVDRFGHCGFSLSELLAGFSFLVERVTAEALVTSSSVFPSRELQREFLELTGRHGGRPVVIIHRD